MNNSDPIEHSLELPGAPASSGGSTPESQASHEVATPVASPESLTASAPTSPPPQNDLAGQQGAPLTPIPPAQAPRQATTTPPMPAPVALTAGDHELIEKVWVEKAKEIVARTHGDPYVQNKEINKIRADYIKKRYNKDIKLGAE